MIRHSENAFHREEEIVMPDLIPDGYGIYDRHPECFETTGFRPSPE